MAQRGSLSVVLVASALFVACGGGGSGSDGGASNTTTFPQQSAEGQQLEGLYSCTATKITDSATGEIYWFSGLTHQIPFYASFNMRQSGLYRYFIGAMNTSGTNHIFGTGEGTLDGLSYQATDMNGNAMSFQFRLVPTSDGGLNDVHMEGEVVLKEAILEGAAIDGRLSIECQNSWNLSLVTVQ